MKPVSQSNLHVAMRQAMAGRYPGLRKPDPKPTRRTIALSPLEPRTGHRSRRILVAEDNSVNQLVVVRILQKLGHDATVVENGELAVEAAASGDYDLVLMDVQMPVMSGFEATAAIRAHEVAKGGHLPIVGLTAHAMKGDMDRCLEAGMDAYLSKPIDIAELTATIERVAVALPTAGNAIADQEPREAA